MEKRIIDCLAGIQEDLEHLRARKSDIFGPWQYIEALEVKEGWMNYLDYDSRMKQRTYWHTNCRPARDWRLRLCYDRFNFLINGNCWLDKQSDSKCHSCFVWSIENPERTRVELTESQKAFFASIFDYLVTCLHKTPNKEAFAL